MNLNQNFERLAPWCKVHHLAQHIVYIHNKAAMFIFNVENLKIQHIQMSINLRCYKHQPLSL